ncbi:MAG: hypothetical protein HYZ28_06450 [Myxococcales bacterium]|nr:hypothetical protein [Myxococcales bacterium]
MAKIVIPDNELNSFDLPRVCVVTGATEGVVFKPVKFSWYPRWVVVLVLVNVLLAAIVAMILTKRVKGELPFTEEAYAAWRKGRVLFGLSIGFALAALVGGIAALANELGPLGGVLMLAALAVPIAVGVVFLRGKGVACVEIAKGHTTLKIPSGEAAMQIERHLRAGGVNRLQAAG